MLNPYRGPQPVNYQTYEAGRENPVTSDSLRLGAKYLLRLMLPQKHLSPEHYADEDESLLIKISNLGHFCMVTVMVAPTFTKGFISGINRDGILFDEDPLPPDIDFPNLAHEFGYFVGEVAGTDLGSGKAKHEDELVLPETRQLILV